MRRVEREYRVWKQELKSLKKIGQVASEEKEKKIRKASGTQKCARIEGRRSELRDAFYRVGSFENSESGRYEHEDPHSESNLQLLKVWWHFPTSILIQYGIIQRDVG